MLLATYKTLHDAHRAIHVIHARFGLTSEQVGCVFVPCGGRPVPWIERVVAWLCRRSPAESTKSCDRDAKQVARHIAGSLHKAVLQVMVTGGVLVAIQFTNGVSEEMLIGALQDYNATAVVVSPDTHAGKQQPLSIPSIVKNVRVLGALSHLGH